jgi:hypothetical protein
MNEKKPIIIACVVLALIVISGGSAIYYFNWVVLPERQKVLDDAIAEVRKAQDKKNLIPKLQAQIKGLKEEEARKRVRIPDLDRMEYDTLANLLDDVRKRAGVNVSRGAYSLPRAAAATPGRPAASTANVHQVQYELSVKGGFHQLLRYLNMLEKDRRFMNVESFTVSKGSDAPTGRTGAKGATQAVRDLKITLTSYTYRLAAPQPLKGLKAEDDKGGVSTDVPE